MNAYRGNPDHVHGSPAQTGILVCNVGTPEAPTPRAVRRYLAEFLSDPRIVELPRWLWMPILHGVILNFRPRRSAHAYASIWQDVGSPLLNFSERIVASLEHQFDARNRPDLVFALGMRYGAPSIASAMEKLRAAGARRILVLPLYPQYASATTGSVYDAVFEITKDLRWLPELRFINQYNAEPGYIEALADSVRNHWRQHGRGQRLLMSFHGIPQETFLAGDPYFCQCQESSRLLAERLDLDNEQWAVSFQSRVGPKRWLEPYTTDVLKQWALEGIGDIDVVCPGFAADCLETLEEIAMQYATIYRDAGGGELRYIGALNDQPKHIEALTDLIERHLGGWPAASDETHAQQALSATRARELGGR